MMASGLAWFDEQRKKYLSVPATCTRGINSVTLDATIEHQRLQLDATYDSRIEHADLDLVFTAADLVFDNAVTTPQRGDIWTVTMNGTAKKFEVLGPGSEAPWHYMPYELEIMVHLKFVGLP